jgi:hypothetical protein
LLSEFFKLLQFFPIFSLLAPFELLLIVLLNLLNLVLHVFLVFLVFLSNMVVFCLETAVLLVHHGDSFVLVHFVVGHRSALKLSIVMRQRFVLFEQFMVTMFPHSACLFVDGLVLDLLVLLNILLNFLKNERMFFLEFPHAFSESIVFFLESQPFLLAIDCQELVGQEDTFLMHSIMFFIKVLVLFVEIVESLSPKCCLSLQFLNVLGSDF